MGSVKCGFSQRVITPLGEGIFMDGYGNRMSPAKGVHDDLYAKTAVFCTKEAEYFAILVLDVCGFNAQIYELLTDYLEAMTGFNKEHIAICATHTHAAPVCGVLDGLPVNYDFWCHTAELCGKAIIEARENLCECSFSGAIADSELTASFNRRKRPYIDRRIKAAVFTGLNGTVCGVIASASCHPVINTTMELSADYPQVLTRRALEEYKVPFLFLQGRCADINPCIPEGMSIDDAMELLGGALTEGVMNAVEKAVRHPESTCHMRSVYQTADIPMKPFLPLEAMEKAYREKLENYTKTPWSLEKHYVLRDLEWHRKMYGKIKRKEKSEISAPFQIFTIGKRLIFVFLPFEVLTNTGNKIEELLKTMGYKAENIFVIGYANIVNGYLAPLEEFPIGGYEVIGASHWYGMPECGELTETTVIETVKEMACSL